MEALRYELETAEKEYIAERERKEPNYNEWAEKISALQLLIIQNLNQDPKLEFD